MYLLDLSQVQYPKNYAEKLKEERDRVRRNLINSGKSEDEVLKLVPDEPFNQVQDVEQTINAALNNFFQLKHLDKESKTIVAPYDLRKKSAKISQKIADMEGSTVDLSDEQMDFLLEVLKIDCPNANQFIYLAEYLEDEKLKQKK